MAIDSSSASSEAMDGFGWCTASETVNGSCLISTDVSWELRTHSLGILARIDNTLDKGYQIKLESNRV